MKRIGSIVLVVLVVTLVVVWQLGRGEAGAPGGKIRSAMSAAPASVARAATILDYPAKEGQQPPVLRKGTNGWSCFPDDPSTPGNDPVCVDKSWIKWFEAYLSKTKPEMGGAGVAYMLQGGSEASNTDPFARLPASSKQWFSTPPHVMVAAPGKLDRTAFPTDHHSGGPWIMWSGTPYEHLMVPVK